MRRGGAFIKCLESNYEGCIHRVLKLAVRCSISEEKPSIYC